MLMLEKPKQVLIFLQELQMVKKLSKPKQSLRQQLKLKKLKKYDLNQMELRKFILRKFQLILKNQLGKTLCHMIFNLIRTMMKRNMNLKKL